jgi:hypothetical protein
MMNTKTTNAEIPSGPLTEEDLQSVTGGGFKEFASSVADHVLPFSVPDNRPLVTESIRGLAQGLVDLIRKKL